MDIFADCMMVSCSERQPNLSLPKERCVKSKPVQMTAEFLVSRLRQAALQSP